MPSYNAADFREICTVKNSAAIPVVLLSDLPCLAETQKTWFRNPYCDVAFTARYDEATVTAYMPTEGFFTIDYRNQHYNVLALLIADQGKFMTFVCCPLMP